MAGYNTQQPQVKTHMGTPESQQHAHNRSPHDKV